MHLRVNDQLDGFDLVDAKDKVLATFYDYELARRILRLLQNSEERDNQFS